MADFVDELGTALQTAFRADTDMQAVFPDPEAGSNYAIEYNSQRTSFVDGVSQGFIRDAGQTPTEGHQHEDSARTQFAFEAWFQVNDPRNANKLLSQAQKGIHNVLRDQGVAILDTHLVDSMSNRLNESGTVTGAITIDPLDEVDPDRPIIRVDIVVELTHFDPLV